MKGFRGKILVVDLSTSKISTEPLNEEIARSFLGGAGYAVRYLYDIIDKDTDPLGEKNPLFFMTGPLTGTPAPTAGRWVVCSKSPLTKIWGESNCGGFFGAELKFAGFDGILVVGASQTPVYLYVTDSVQELRPADDLWGLGVYKTTEILKERHDHSHIACIGPGGENLVKYAVIASEERIAGRTGMGAVMGSKKLKAVAVHGENKNIELESPAREAGEEVMEIFTTQMFQDLGTSGAVDMYNYRGQLPIKYWTQGEFEGAYSISGASIKETILVKNYHCFACPIGCGRIVTIKEGEYKTPHDIKGPEYETIVGYGSQLLNDNLEAISKANYLCNDWGIDTISSSVTIALVYYLCDKGLLTAADLDGINPQWGDITAALNLIPLIARREGIGNTLADGADAVGRKFAVTPDEIATVDGMEVTYHDLRSTFGMALA
jgi:aldehyde:ferredoxin oxidoreductase